MLFLLLRQWWIYQLKLDGYGEIAYKAKGKLYLRSRNDNDFTVRYFGVANGLAGLPMKR